MALRLVSRSFIYIAFIVSVIVSWLFKQRHTSRGQANGESDLEVFSEDALHHPRWQMRLKAVQRLGDTPESIQFPQLQALLNDPDSDVREMVAAVLAKCGTRFIPDLLAAFDGVPLDGRVTIVHALSHIDSTETIPGLTYALKDESVWVRLPAVQALAHFSNEAAVSALGLALDDPDDEIKTAAERALKQISTPAARKILRVHATVTTDS